MADTTLTAYRHLLGAQVRSQSQYRASFVADVVGSLMFGVIDVASVVVVFRVTPTLGGFGFAEVFLMTALAGCAFALADLAVGNVERLRQYVRSGLFDALLVRPLSSLARQIAVLDPDELPGTVLAWVLVTLDRESTKHHSGFQERMRGAPEVQQCYDVAGPWDYLVMLATNGMPRCRELLVELFKDAPNVKRFETLFVFEAVKVGLGIPLRPAQRPRARRAIP